MTGTTRTPETIRPMFGGADPYRTTNGRKEGDYDLGVFIQGAPPAGGTGGNGVLTVTLTKIIV